MKGCDRKKEARGDRVLVERQSEGLGTWDSELGEKAHTHSTPTTPGAASSKLARSTLQPKVGSRQANTITECKATSALFHTSGDNKTLLSKVQRMYLLHSRSSLQDLLQEEYVYTAESAMITRAIDRARDVTEEQSNFF